MPNLQEVFDALPDWGTCSEKRAQCVPLTALEAFIYDNEPAGGNDEQGFRRQLAAVLMEAATATGTAPAPAQPVQQPTRTVPVVHPDGTYDFGRTGGFFDEILQNLAQPVAPSAEAFVAWIEAQPHDREPNTLRGTLAEFLAAIKEQS